MDILGQTVQDHYVDCISKTFKKLIFSKKPKNKPQNLHKAETLKFPSGPNGEGSTFRQIPKW